jgi:hypothetical protein
MNMTPRAIANALQQMGIRSAILESELDRAAEDWQGWWLERAIPRQTRRGVLVGCYREDHASRYTPDGLPATIYIEIWQRPHALELERYLQLPTPHPAPHVEHSRHSTYPEAKLTALTWLIQARAHMQQAQRDGYS